MTRVIKDNGVVPEQYDADAISKMQSTAEALPIVLWRQKCGSWSLSVNLGMSFTLPDGRVVKFSRVIGLSHGQGTPKKHHRRPGRAKK